MRWVGWVLVVGTSGCGLAYAPALAILPVVPMVAPVPTQPQMHLTAGAEYVSGGDETGGAAELTGTMIGGAPVGIAGYTRLELGKFDNTFGSVEGELGVGLGGPGLHVGVLAGMAYGGYLQNAKSFPLRTTVMFDMEAIAAQATFYAGWRLGVDGDDAFRTLGPWNTWGGRIDATVHQGLGPTLGLSWDRQDDITTFGVHVGVGAHAPTL